MNAPGYIIEWMARNQWRNGTYFVKKYLNGQEKKKKKNEKEKTLGSQHM
jgi:hypothetical protein